MAHNLTEVYRGRARRTHHRDVSFWGAVLAIGLACSTAHAAVSLLGVQYIDDNVFEEFACEWHDRNYPPPCAADIKGAHAHVFIKNDGASAITITDVTLAGYSLSTVIKSRTYGDHPPFYSIHHYWLTPPQDIIDAGEPVWYKGDPKTIPAGGVGQAIIRLRWEPSTPTIAVGVVTTGGTINTTITVNPNQPELASVGYSSDLTKVYLHWRRAGGAAPSTIIMDGADVTADTVTVGDASNNFAVSVISLGAAVSEMSYHVYQGFYSDSATASAGLRTRVQPIMYGTWHSFEIPDGGGQPAIDWVNTCFDRGINALIMQSSGGLTDYLQSGAGRAHAAACDYRGVIDYPGKFGMSNPMMWFLDDETDIEEDTTAKNFCNDNQKKLPCGGDPTGTLAMYFISAGESLRGSSNSPTTINMDGTYKPRNYYAYGQAVDSLMIDSYYQKRVMDSYYYESKYATRPLYEKATVIYATCRAGTTASEPNPFNILLFSCEANPSCCDPWPFAPPETKRTEVYYALAGGAKGIGYWWFKPGGASNGLGDQGDPRARALWKEIGLLGTEIKTVQPFLTRGCPVDLDVQGSTNVWVRAMAVDVDTFLLFVVNDDHWNDEDWHSNDVTNATVTMNLPTWMQSPTPTAFEISPGGLGNVSTQVNGTQLELSLGTLEVTRMIVVTTNPVLRATIQQRYENEVWPGVCNFASEYCVPQNNPPTITQQPSNQEVAEGGSANFAIMAAGTSPLSYQWQKNQVNLNNGGHYSGCTTAVLTISSADSGDEASYRCVVTNPYGSATSNAATLTLEAPGPPTITQQPTDQQVIPDGAADFTVTAVGTAPISYQWQKNQVNLSNGGHYTGVTTPTLTVSSVNASDEANYRCVVTNNYGSTNSNSASLTVAECTTPVLLNGGFESLGTDGIAASWTGYTRAEVPTNVSYSQQIDMEVEGIMCQQIQTSYVASGGAGVYQVMTGCMSGATYNISGWMKTDSTHCRATVKCAPGGGTSYSSAIDLIPSATTTSTSWVQFGGDVLATGPTMTLFLDSQTYVSGSADQAARFDGLTIECGSSCAEPTITQHPSDIEVDPGWDTQFSVTASGTGPFTYQWQKDQVNLSNSGHIWGTNESILFIFNLVTEDAGQYRCIVTGNCGNATSNEATLTVGTTVNPVDYDLDGDVDMADFGEFQICLSASGEIPTGCDGSDLNNDDAVDALDLSLFLQCLSGADIPSDPNCAN